MTHPHLPSYVGCAIGFGFAGTGVGAESTFLYFQVMSNRAVAAGQINGMGGFYNIVFLAILNGFVAGAIAGILYAWSVRSRMAKSAATLSHLP